MRVAVRSSFSLSLTLLIACGPPAGMVDGGVDAPRDSGPPDRFLGGDARPARLVLPFEHDGTTLRPLVVLLHGYSVSAGIQDRYLQLSEQARARGMYVLLPDGTFDAEGARFWNATDGCCNFGGEDVDDVGYLTGLLDEAAASVPVDPARVYFVGHSNGGFMSYRMACEVSGRIAAIATLAGSDYLDETACVPDDAPSVLHIHGTADATIAFEGGTVGSSAFPSARVVIERWAMRAGCDATMPTAGGAIDLESTIAGAETVVTDFTAGCTDGRSASLWTIEGGSHIPTLEQPEAIEAILDWLLAHER